MDITSLVNKKIAIEIILSQIFIVSAIIYLLFFRKRWDFVLKFMGKYGIVFAFIIATASTAASLFYSEIAGFEPCELCWFQRIFIYPSVILLGSALIKKDFHIVDYVLSLSAVGFLISLYHNYIYYSNEGLNSTCQILGSQVSCVKRYVFEFGYVTIPMMALTAFALIILFLVFHKLQNRKSI